MNDIEPTENDIFKPPQPNPVLCAPKLRKPTLEFLKEQIRKIKETYFQLESNSPKNVSLRWMIKRDGIALHLNKTKIQEAIHKNNIRMNAVLSIQRFVRGFLAKQFWQKFKRGNNIRSCVNHTDFYTLEPLEEMDVHEIFFCKSGEHTYGFNINSLLIYYGKSRSVNNNQLLNPYNREIICRKNVQQFLNLSTLFFPKTFLELRDKPHYKTFMGKVGNDKRIPPNNTVRVVRPTVFANITEPANNNTADQNVIHIPEVIYGVITTNRNAIIYNPPIISGETQQEVVEHLAELESLPIRRRIHELFIEFDLLGNYTDANWFLSQNLRGYRVYYIKLQELWNHLPPFVQQSICCVGDPFYLVEVHNIHQQPFENMREACLKVMEYITHGGISREDQKLGIYQILISLTFISREARHSMNHLL